MADLSHIKNPDASRQRLRKSHAHTRTTGIAKKLKKGPIAVGTFTSGLLVKHNANILAPLGQVSWYANIKSYVPHYQHAQTNVPFIPLY